MNFKLLVFLVSSLVAACAAAENKAFNDGQQFGKSNKGLQDKKFKDAGNNIGNYVPGIDAKRAQNDYGKYYGGVDGTGKDMTQPGQAIFDSQGSDEVSQASQAIKEHKRNAANMPGVNGDDEFLKNAQDAESNAEQVFDPKLCKDVSFNKVKNVDKSCVRDLEVGRTCQRTAVIEWTGKKEKVTGSFDWVSSAGEGFTRIYSRYQQGGKGTGGNSCPTCITETYYYGKGDFKIKLPIDGKLTRLKASITGSGLYGSAAVKGIILGHEFTAKKVRADGLDIPLSQNVKKGDVIDLQLLTGEYKKKDNPDLVTSFNYIQMMKSCQKGSNGTSACLSMKFDYEYERSTVDAKAVWHSNCN